jgi:ComF family protein
LKRPFASVTSIANYEGLLRSLVIRMKSRYGQALAIQLGHWLATCLCDRPDVIQPAAIDLVTPIPVHWTRRLRRGFNVPALLVESICRQPDYQGKSRNLLVASRKTRKQGTLNLSQRFKNVKNCFDVDGKPDIAGARILLVDDVMTSGATTTEAAAVLRRYGASEIHLAIVARGIGRQP